MTELEKRTWHYLQPPATYEMAPCTCGNHHTQLSEFKGRLWCEKCQIDFVPEHGGIFDGPIPVAVCGMLGISFDVMNLETGRVEPFQMPVSPAQIANNAGPTLNNLESKRQLNP